jgi:cellobiose transport system substrate-binding protein
MSVTKHRLSRVAAVALVSSVALGAAVACGSDEPVDPGAKPEVLVVDTFGNFGYAALAQQFEQEHGVKVQIRNTAQLGDYTPQLVRYLATGQGAGDVVALEEGIITRFNPGNFVDLRPYVGDIDSEYLEWKFKLGIAPNGKLFGLPTDVGSLGVCYRTDLFEEAGLPTDRDEVSDLWPTWEDFAAVGKDYRAATGKALLDSVTTAMSARIVQTGGEIYYTADYELYKGAPEKENLVAANSKAVADAWELADLLIENEVTAKVSTWSPEWTEGFKTGTFAATLCPSWMTGIVEGNSGEENAGKWDIAAVPGGGGNWGGSWLAVPTTSKYPEWAARLARFLTDAHGQVEAFKEAGPLPTNLEALQNPEFQAYTNAYFNNAPTGKIFGETVQQIKPVIYGPRHADVRERAMEPAARLYEQGTLTREAAFDQFLTDVPLQGQF